MINIRRKLEIQREANSGRRGAEIQAWTEGRVVVQGVVVLFDNAVDFLFCIQGNRKADGKERNTGSQNNATFLERAEYGSNLLERLSRDLTDRFGKGFSRSNILYMRKFYRCFPNSETLSHVLSWSHYFEILHCEDPLEISFYAKECEKERWSVRELKRQIGSALFARFALSKDKEGILQLANQGIEIQKPEDIIHDPYVLEFTGLPALPTWSEKDLEEALVSNLGNFMLELGKGFALLKQQYHIPLGGRHFYVDLVFYNVILKTYCLIDLKKNGVQHEDIGQMNLYLNYFRHEVCREGDNEPFGIILGAAKDRLTVQYALEGISNQLFVSRYQLYLPDRESLSREVYRIIEAHEKEKDDKE